MRLSIIIPCFNSEKTLPVTLESIKASFFTDYEIVIVSDGSTDNTTKIARKYTQKIIDLKIKSGPAKTRNIGFRKAQGKIIVNIDSDVVIEPNTLSIINNFFLKNLQVKALTGMLSTESRYNNFTSDYKNLYMNYYYSISPEQVSFLYGSIFALRKELVNLHQVFSSRKTDDTEFGQYLYSNGIKIMLLKKLIVHHHKKFNLLTLLINDFKIPYDWAKIFLRYKGWKELKNSKQYAHASIKQIYSLFLSALIVVLLLISLLISTKYLVLMTSLVFIWFYLNFSFYSFLYQNRGLKFTLSSILFTFIDNLVMVLGIISGSCAFILSRLNR